MAKEISLVFYSDPGHGWLAVPKRYVDELGLWDDISSCSYDKGFTLYLEKDSDAGKFMKAAEDAGWNVDIEYKNTDRSSPIRSYNSYNKDRRNYSRAVYDEVAMEFVMH